MSYAIFRVQGIRTTGDLKGIGKHNLERVSYTNLDIDSSMFDENIHLISPADSKSYMNRFSEIVKPMKLEHDEKMKNERKDRVKSFEAKINSSKNDVASEFLFTSDEKFFEGMNKDQVKKWAETCLDFVKKDIGIQESHMLHAVVHMDEKTPHLHIVAVPLVKKMDGRAKREVWQINRKHFIGSKDQLSELQDKYHQHMLKHGYDLERGVKGSESRHVNPVKFKVQEEVKKLETKREALKSDVEDLLQSVQITKKVDEIPVEEKKSLLGSSKTVKIASDDFELIKTLAKTSEGLKTNEKALKIEIKELKDQNIILKNQQEQVKKENRKLVQTVIKLENQNEQLQRKISLYQKYQEHLEKLIERLKKLAERNLGVKFEKMANFVAVLRVDSLMKNFGATKETMKDFVPDNEMKYAAHYAQRFEEQQLVAEKPEEKYKAELKREDDQGMER